MSQGKTHRAERKYLFAGWMSFPGSVDHEMHINTR
jgi:hypothetical protein